MEFLIISGMSGAGKSRAADILEDLDYYCVDNLPVALIPRFAELCMATQDRYERVALVMDIRERDGFDELFHTLDSLKSMGCTYRMLFMDADIPTLIKRYKESRRPHPLAVNGRSTEDAIREEFRMLTPVRARADYIINTSGLTLGMLQQRVFALFAGEGKKRNISVTVTAFGYKYGIPMDADLVLDVFDARIGPADRWPGGLLVGTHVDLAGARREWDAVYVGNASGEGLAELRRTIAARLLIAASCAECNGP